MKKTILFASVFTLAVIISIIAFILSTMPKSDITDTTEPPVKNPGSKVADSNPNLEYQYVSGSDITGYMMKSENSLIHIYEMYDNGNKQLIDSLDINPATLPDTDKDELTKGIVLTSYEKMLGLIEDYSS